MRRGGSASAHAGASLRALVSQGGEGEGPRAADELGLRWEAARALSGFLDRVEDDPPRFALLSFGVDGVDVPLALRVGEVLTAQGSALFLSAPKPSLEWAVVARRLGCGALLSEPISASELVPELRRRLEAPEGVSIPPGASTQEDGELVGSGSAMMDVVRAVAEVGDAPTTVLITGESGTGKELLARALHRTSGRRERPFVAINCAAVPENLLESEFFGHERGAFTGAVAVKRGRFERADGGTLFLDEIGDMSLVLQAKLLRALEQREVERVGGETPIPVDVRIAAATNQELEGRVARGEFREDLYYRIAVARIHLPPLRERLEDLEELVVHFVSLFSEKYGRAIQGIGSDAIRALRGHAWPGNIRELRNVLDRAVLASRGGWIRAEDLQIGPGSPSLSASESGGEGGGGYPPSLPLEEVERDHIARVLSVTNGAIAEAAEILGIHRNTLTRKVERYGLRDG